MGKGKYEFMERTERIKSAGGVHFKGIKLGGVVLSVQGSVGHYCTPKETLSIDEYELMEVAIIKEEGEVFLTPEELDLYFNISKGIKEKLQERFDGMVYGHVPVEVIEELYQTLK